MADQLVTEAQVNRRLNIGDAVDQAMVVEIIEEVSDEIQHFCRRKLVPDNAATYTFDTALGHTLQIPRGIRSVTSMSIAATDQPDTGGVYQAVAAAAILLRPLPAELRPGWPPTEIRLLYSPIDTRLPFRTAANGATITGNFGFAATPPVIQRIALQAIVAEYLDRRAGGSRGAEGIDLPSLLNASQLAALARFRAGIGIF